MSTEQNDRSGLQETDRSKVDFHAEVGAVWEQNAAFWDDYMGEQGNQFHRELVAPAAERLLALQPNETVLEIACGSGLFARRMAELGAQVVATDVSQTFLERARMRTADYADRITFHRIDATDEQALLTLGESRFDAAVSNMALMDIPDIDPLLSALSRLLKPGGRFVFTVMHPSFNNSGCTRMIEEDDRSGEVVVTYSIKVSQYLSVTTSKGVGIRGQPVPQYYFNRPLHVLLNACFRVGFVLDGLEEPAFHSEPTKPRSLALDNFQELPMVLAAGLYLK